MSIYTKDHFNQEAVNYDKTINSWPLSLIRKQEKNGLIKTLGAINDLSVLELGSGNGFHTRMLLSLGVKHIDAMDFAKDMLKNLPSKGVTKHCLDAQDFNLNNTYDLIFSSGLLEFINHPELVFKNISNHSNKNTRLIVMVPDRRLMAFVYKIYHLTHKVNIRLFSENQLIKLGADVGFEVKSLNHVSWFSMIAEFVKK